MRQGLGKEMLGWWWRLPIGNRRYGRLEICATVRRQETDEQKAERLVQQELGHLGWAEADLHSLRKGDQRKVAIARRLRQETTLSLKWIAQRLDMGSWTYVSNLLRAAAQGAASVQQQLLLCQ